MDDFATLKKRSDRIQNQADDAYNTMGRRILAAMVDASLILAFSLVVEALLLLLDRDQRYPVYRFLVLVFGILYPVITTKLLGGTIGKVYFRLVVVSTEDKGALTWLQSWAREAINAVLSLGDAVSVLLFFAVMSQTSYQGYLAFVDQSPLFQTLSVVTLLVAVVELVTASVSKTRRSLHDFVAGTVVVKTGPYRPWSNFVAIGGVVLAAWLQSAAFPWSHN